MRGIQITKQILEETKFYCQHAETATKLLIGYVKLLQTFPSKGEAIFFIDQLHTSRDYSQGR
jgi:hypothetical protein